MQKIGYIGLGRMGQAIAGHIARQGYPLVVYNRTTEKSHQFAKDFPGTIVAQNLADLATQVEVIISCVYDDQSLLDISTEILPTIRPGTIWIDHSTISPTLARSLSEQLTTRDSFFLDGPVSGGEKGAVEGTLAIMVGGEASALAKIQPIVQTYSAQITHMGPTGHGQLAKIVNQICVVGILQGLSEGLAFAQKTGLDIEKLLNTISKGAAQSWQMDNRARDMAQGNFDEGFPVEGLKKDLDICLSEGRALGLPMPVTHLVQGIYTAMMKNGDGALNHSAIIKYLLEKAWK